VSDDVTIDGRKIGHIERTFADANR